MQPETIKALIDLNRAFYMTYAASFHKTRLTPWNGWKSLLELLPEQEANYLDIGCGNGRWFRYLSDSSINLSSGIGIDLDTYLLGQARYAFINNPAYRFYQGDCIENLEECLTHVGKPKVISCFGLWHHIPSFELRLKNIKILLDRLEPGGALMISMWQFANDPEYAKKLVGPEEAVTHLKIDPNDLEEGDYFLGWQAERSILRFCHSFSDKEIMDLALATGKKHTLTTGTGNDATNIYLTLFA
jgi:SAM-dependent methyltransferase